MIKRANLLLFGLLLCLKLSAQQDYIKFHNKLHVNGTIHSTTSSLHGIDAIEFTEATEGSKLKHYKRNDIFEYCHKKDTFRVLKEFKPFDNHAMYFDFVDAKVLKPGKVSLLGIDAKHSTIIAHTENGSLHSVMDAAHGQLPFIYVLHQISDGYAMGIPSNKKYFREVMMEFFGEEVIASYEKEHGELHFRHLEKFLEKQQQH